MIHCSDRKEISDCIFQNPQEEDIICRKAGNDKCSSSERVKCLCENVINKKLYLIVFIHEPNL